MFQGPHVSGVLFSCHFWYCLGVFVGCFVGGFYSVLFYGFAFVILLNWSLLVIFAILGL